MVRPSSALARCCLPIESYNMLMFCLQVQLAGGTVPLGQLVRWCTVVRPLSAQVRCLLIKSYHIPMYLLAGGAESLWTAAAKFSRCWASGRGYGFQFFCSVAAWLPISQHEQELQTIQ